MSWGPQGRFSSGSGGSSKVFWGGVLTNGETSAEGARFLGWSGGILPGKFLKFGSLKWHFQHSEKTFWKIFRFLKHLKIQKA
jgi:hypothetical protein